MRTSGTQVQENKLIKEARPSDRCSFLFPLPLPLPPYPLQIIA